MDIIRYWLLYQVSATGRNDPSSNSVSGSTFAKKIGRNLIIRVRNTTNYEHPQPIRDAVSFRFWGQRSSVTIHLFSWIDFKTLWRVPEANIS